MGEFSQQLQYCEYQLDFNDPSITRFKVTHLTTAFTADSLLFSVNNRSQNAAAIIYYLLMYFYAIDLYASI